MRARRLRTEYRKNPIGIGNRIPRLMWNAEGGTVQSAYEIRTWKNGKEGWASGKIESADMSAVYGDMLSSRDRVEWEVRLYDEDENVGEWSDTQVFEAGLLEREDWQALWICGQGTDREERLPADYYRKTFAAAGEVAKARLYITACGIYEAKINGKHVGDSVLNPGCTQYDKRLYYQTFDVTSLIREENVLDIVVGDGWFKGKLGCDGQEYLFGTQTRVLAQLELAYADGSIGIVRSDESFLWSNQGPVLYSDMKDGICMDLTRQPVFNQNACATSYPVLPTASDCPPIKEHEVFGAKVQKSPSGKTILDFGQNMAGYVRFHLTGEKGQKITVRMGETLDCGEFTQENFATLPDRGKSIDQKIEVTCDGEHIPEYPVLFYSGFRYALVEGLEQVTEQDFSAVAVYTDLEYGGSFTCSNEDINQFVRNTIWSEKGNFIDIPTDCPQREKAGWTGDAQVFLPTAMFFADGASFFRKWLKDVRDCQSENGRVDNVCPKVARQGEADAMNGSTGWADAAVIIPYYLWKSYGDDSFIRDNYELMHGWKEYVMASAKDKGFYKMMEGTPMMELLRPYIMGEDVPYSEYLIESGMHWGEWAEPEGVLEIDSMVELLRPKQEEAAAYAYSSMKLLAEMLEAVGKEEEAMQCRSFSEGAKKAYQYHFVKDGRIDSRRQGKLVRPLALGLLDDRTAETVAAQLNRTAIDRDYKIGTGFLSTPFILQVLADHGYADTAYHMLENTKEPGWLAMVKQGATTVWEHYNGYDRDGHPLDTSYNHYSPGAVCRFLLEYTAGIRQDGERRFRIHPVIGGTLEHARAEWLSPYGTIKSKWMHTGDGTEYEFEIPSNCQALVELPDGTEQEIPAGVHRYRVKA